MKATNLASSLEISEKRTMKNLRFEKLELLSLTEQKARTIEFHPRLTVITGENSVGKSSVIKSIYWAFGATPAVVNPRWQRANVKAMVTFTIDGVRYRILRSQDRIAVFDRRGELLLSTSSITSELGPFVAKLLNFGLILSNRKGEPEIPPPAYAFLPFYVDQDAGWARPFTSFANLGQYANFKRSLVDFHSGILPNEYYELSAEKRKRGIDRDEVVRDRTAVQKAIERLGLEAGFSGLELTEVEHEDSIENLLQRLKSLRLARQERAAHLAEILDQRTLIEEQVRIVKRSADELSKDTAFAAAYEREEIPCPTCGTIHLNNFSNRFAILEDREACFEFLADGQQKIRDLSVRVGTVQVAMREADSTIEEIRGILSEQRGEVTLRDVIETEGRRAAAGLFADQIKELEDKIGQLSIQITDIDKKLADLKDPKRRERIEAFYAGRMVDYLKRLNAVDIDYDAAGKIVGTVVETGSEHPRALLAYVLAFFDTVWEHTSSFAAPMVIDSPVQQEQDATNAPAIIKLILDVLPDGAQAVLGTVSLHGNAVNHGDIIMLTDKSSALSSKEYPVLFNKMRAYIDKM